MSVTYKQAKPESIERAVAKARQLKPRVKINGFNDFTVTGSKGDTYQVRFSGKGQDFTTHCTCKASERELICYHSVACAPLYKGQVIARAQARVCPGCLADDALEEICICVNEDTFSAPPVLNNQEKLDEAMLDLFGHA